MKAPHRGTFADNGLPPCDSADSLFVFYIFPPLPPSPSIIFFPSGNRHFRVASSNQATCRCGRHGRLSCPIFLSLRQSWADLSGSSPKSAAALGHSATMRVPFLFLCSRHEFARVTRASARVYLGLAIVHCHFSEQQY